MFGDQYDVNLTRKLRDGKFSPRLERALKDGNIPAKVFSNSPNKSNRNFNEELRGDNDLDHLSFAQKTIESRLNLGINNLNEGSASISQLHSPLVDIVDASSQHGMLNNHKKSLSP